MNEGLEHQAYRQPAAIVALAFAAFIIYGSLFPFEFTSEALPIETIFVDWNPLLKTADAIDNVLLFVPLGTALWFTCRSWGSRCALAATSWILLGVGMQLVQLYIPIRVASVADAISNAAGMAIGLLLAWMLTPLLQRKQLLSGVADPMALLLVAFWYGYESYPFVPTLDIGLLAAHIKPVFMLSEFDFLRLLRHTLAAALGTSILLAAQPLSSRRACITLALAVLLTSEVLVPYGELRLENMLGILGGTMLGERLNVALGTRNRWSVLAMATAALTMTVLTAFRPSVGSSPFTITPFSQALWQGTTQGVPTAAFEALAIGALMWAGVTTSPPIGVRAWVWPAVVVLAVACFEALRIALASGFADTSMLVMSLLLAPFANALRARQSTVAAPTTSTSDNLVPERAAKKVATNTIGISERFLSTSRLRLLWPVCQVAAVLVLLALGLRLLLAIPGMPYNVVELFGTHSVVSFGLFSAALLWLGAGPWCVSHLICHRFKTVLVLPWLLVMAALTSLLLLSLSTSEESLGDITGATDLYRRVTTENYWGSTWQHIFIALPADMVSAIERGVRYTALYAVFLVPLTMACIFTDRTCSMRRTWSALAVLAPCWWLASWVVIDGAITDNLTELIAPQGSPWLAALIAGFAVNVAWVARPAGVKVRYTVRLLTLLSLPTGWWLLKQGLEQTILKYDSVWSAQQFLLGQDRRTLLSDGALFMRWSALYLAALGICVLGMLLARRVWVASTAVESTETAAARSIGHAETR